jgi:hypothetical protein
MEGWGYVYVLGFIITGVVAYYKERARQRRRWGVDMDFLDFLCTLIPALLWPVFVPLYVLYLLTEKAVGMIQDGR